VTKKKKKFYNVVARMAALVMLNTKSMLERHLDVILSEEEKKHPLRFPPSDKYRFAEPNTDENIVYEEREKSNGIPLIKVRQGT
jgi:son of sevenless-like protein